MIIYIIYIILSPLLFVITLISSLFSYKLRNNIFSFYFTLMKVKKYLRHHRSNKEVLLFHAASAGEYEQLKPILRNMNREKYVIIQSFTSPTIYKEAKGNTLADIICYQPLDFLWFSYIYFNTIRPQKYIITRHDLWPTHIIVAKLLLIKIYFINANIHKRSLWQYSGFKSLGALILNKIDFILVPSSNISENIIKITSKKKQPIICGDSRFDQVYFRFKNNEKQILPNYFESLNTTIFGSIDYYDQNLILSALKQKYPQGTHNLVNNQECLIFVTHENTQETIESIIKELRNCQFKIAKFSSLNLRIKEHVLVVDELGYLADLYKYAKKAYVGGGFSKGVHSILEPAIYNCNIGHGPNIEMLDEAKTILNNGDSTLINNSNDMYNFLSQSNTNIKVKSYILNNINATKKICSYITQ